MKTSSDSRKRTSRANSITQITLLFGNNLIKFVRISSVFSGLPMFFAEPEIPLVRRLRSGNGVANHGDHTEFSLNDFVSCQVLKPFCCLFITNRDLNKSVKKFHHG